MPAELVACLFISGFAIMIGLTIHVHRQKQNVLEIMKRQQEKQEFIDGLKQRIDSDFSDDLARLGRMDQHIGDQESEFDH